MLTEMSQHLALYGRFLLMPFLAVGLLWGYYAEGRFRQLWGNLQNGGVQKGDVQDGDVQSGGFQAEDIETLLVLLFGAAVAAVGAHNSWQLIVDMYLTP
jgi:hypothetical protein